MRLLIINCFLVLSFIQTVYAQDKFLSKKITDTNGQSIAFSFKKAVVDRDGVFWLSTEMGLYKYDGTYTTQVLDPRFPAIKNNRITKLALDYVSGDVTFGTYPEHGIYSIHNNTIYRLGYTNKSYQYIFSFYYKCLSPNSNYTKSIINYLNKNNSSDNDIPDGEKSLIKVRNSFFITIDTMLLVFNKDKLPKKYVFPNSNILQLVSNNNETYVFDYNKKGAKVYKYTEDIDFNTNINAVKVDQVITSFMQKMVEQNSNQFLRQNFLFDTKNYYLCFDGVIYKLVFSNNNIRAVAYKKNLKNSVCSILYLKKDEISIESRFANYIEVLYSNKFHSVAIKDAETNMSYSIKPFAKNRWFLDSGWEYDKTNNKLIKHNFKDISKGFLMGFNNTNYYFGKDYCLYNVKTNLKLESFPSGNPLRAYTYLKNILWVCDGRIVKYHLNNQFVTDTFLSNSLNKLDINNISAFNNELIVETSKGSFYYQPFKKLTPIKGLEQKYARYFKAIDHTSFWVITYGDGMYLVKNKVAYKVIDKNIDFNTNTAHGIEEDKQGNLWISTNNGIVTINKKRIITNTLNHQPVTCYKFTTDDGLLTNDHNGVSTHTSLQTEDGTIAFPTVEGLVWFKPEEITKHPFKGNIVIEKLIVDNKNTIHPDKNNYFIPKASNVLSFTIGYNYYFNRENITITYRFEDQPEWTEVKTNIFQLGRYKSGTHKLFIRISTHGFDDKQDVIKSFQLDFEARYYEETWFWFLIALFVFTIIAISYRVGLYINKKRAEELQSKINSKTAELSLNIIQLESSKGQLSKSLYEKEILLKEIHHRVKNNLQIIMSLLNIEAQEGTTKTIEEFLEISESRIHSMAMIHQSLYENNNLDSIVFQQYLEQLVSHLASIMGVNNNAIAFQIEAKDILLEIETAISLGLIVNELLTNTFKYAFPKQEDGKVGISIQQKAENEYELVYSDNGIGYDTAEQTNVSFGLELVKMLVKELKGTVVKVPIAGTKYSITFHQMNSSA